MRCVVLRSALLLSLVVVSPSEAQEAAAPKPGLELVGAGDKPRALTLRLESKPRMALRGALVLPVRNTGPSALQLRIRYAGAGLDRLVTLPGASGTVTLAGDAALGRQRLETLAGSLSATDPRATARALLRAGRAPLRGTASAAGRRLVGSIRRSLAGDVTAAEAGAVADALAPLLVRSGRAAPRLAADAVKPVLDGIDESAGRNALAGALSTLDRAVRSARYPVVPAGELRAVTLAFTLSPERNPADLTGTAVLEGFTGATPKTEARVSAAVDATARPISGATFEPKKVRIQVTRARPNWWWGQDITGEEDVRVVGPGAGDALADLRRAGADGAAAVLRAEDGEALPVTLGPITADPQDPAIASAPLILEGDADPGKYAGGLPLSRFASTSPAVDVEVLSRLWFPWAILLILVGVVLAGWLTHHVGLSRRKDLLRRYLQAFAKDYADQVPHNRVDGELLIGELDLVYPLTVDPGSPYFAKLDSPRSVYTAVHWARNDADLDEAAEAAHAQAARISGWLRTAAEIRKLHDLSKEDHGVIEIPWPKTKTAMLTRVLLRRARRDPPVEPDDPLFDRIERHLRWHRAFAIAWDLWLEATQRQPGSTQELLPTKLDQELDAGLTDEAHDALEEQLEQLTGALERLAEMSRVDVTDGPVHDTHTEGLRAQHAAVAHSGRRGRTLLAQQKALPAEAVAVGLQGGNWARLAQRFRNADLMLTFVILALTSLTYGLTIYDGTWGSWSDGLTALLAGFAGQVVIKWALLPAYRSIRLTAQAAQDRGQPAAAAATQLSAPAA
jgi:hypothetical protein